MHLQGTGTVQRILLVPNEEFTLLLKPMVGQGLFPLPQASFE